MVKILGVCGSQRVGATDYIIQKALESIADREGIETQYITLHKKKIEPCTACGYCRNKKDWCILKDDMQELFDIFIEADAYLVGCPVYAHTITPQILNFFTRMRPLHHVFPDKLRTKLGAVVAVGGTRNGGQEAAATTLIHLMLTRGINVVSNEIGGYIGGKVWSRDIKNFKMEDDEIGMNTVIPLAGKLADMAMIVHKGLNS